MTDSDNEIIKVHVLWSKFLEGEIDIIDEFCRNMENMGLADTAITANQIRKIIQEIRNEN
jgi:hypothetical protein